MNAISSYEASSKTRTRRQSHVAHQALTAASSKVAPARRAIHPDLAVRARQQDEFLRRLHRFSPLFDGAYTITRARHEFSLETGLLSRIGIERPWIGSA